VTAKKAQYQRASKLGIHRHETRPHKTEGMSEVHLVGLRDIPRLCIKCIWKTSQHKETCTHQHTDPTYHTPSTNHHTSNKIIHLPYIASRHLSVTFAWTGLCQMSLCTTLRRSKHTTLSRLCGLHFQCSYTQPAVVYKHIYMCVMLSALAAFFRAHSLPLL